MDGNPRAWSADFTAFARRLLLRSPLLYRAARGVRSIVLTGRFPANIAAPALPVSQPVHQEPVSLLPEMAAAALDRASSHPLVSIVVPVYKVAPQWLERCIQSVENQYYPNWQLILVDDCSQDPQLSALINNAAARDRRIVALSLEANSGISASTNRGLEAATGTFVGFLDHDDELSPDALTWFVIKHNRHPDAQWFYSDEDVIGPQGEPVAQAFKPDYSPEYLFAAMYTCHFSVYSTDLLRRAGGCRLGFEGAQDHDLALRLSELVRPDQVVHIPRILYHWRQLPGSTAAGGQEKPYAAIAGRRAVQEALTRRGLKGDVFSHDIWPTLYQVRLHPQSFPRVSILIPTRNGIELLKKCLTSLREHTSYPNYEVVVIDNQSDDPELLEYLQQEENAHRLRVVHYPKPFNHSAMHNEVAPACNAEFFVFMNNDVEILSDQWIEQLVATAQMDPSIAGVGGMLIYPDGMIQHAGIIFGLGGVVGHSHKHLPADQPGYCGRAHAIQEVSGATAALLLLRASAFQQVGGFSEQRYPTSYNDLDLWLKLRRDGHRCLYNPQVRAIHYEGKSRGIDVPRDLKIQEYLKQDWGDRLTHDPFYNPNLAIDNEQFQGRRVYPVDLDELQPAPDARECRLSLHACRRPKRPDHAPSRSTTC